MNCKSNCQCARPRMTCEEAIIGHFYYLDFQDGMVSRNGKGLSDRVYLKVSGTGEPRFLSSEGFIHTRAPGCLVVPAGFTLASLMEGR